MPERTVAIVTPSYAGDLERCRVLCDSIDRRVRGHTRHYLLVADHDFDLFAEFEGPKRTVLGESTILPETFIALRPPVGRPLWLSAFAWPLRGWHVQQLRRIALAQHVDATALLYCDSDMAFVRPFDVDDLWRGDALRLYRNAKAIDAQLLEGGREHMDWTIHAHALLGLATPSFPAHDYINNLVSWRRADVLAMLERIEEVTGRPWMRAVTAQRAFSECQIYGAYTDHLANPNDRWIDETPLCLTKWDGGSMGEEALSAFVSSMSAEQVAVGVQSFTGTDPAAVRRVLGL